MNIEVTKNAQKWFEEEFDVTGQNGIRLFAKYGGSNSSLHHGFSIGITAAEPVEAVVTVREGNLMVFIEEHDYWYFKDHDWKVDYHPDTEEIDFRYTETVQP